MEIKNKIFVSLIIFLVGGILMGKVSEVDQAFYFLILLLPVVLILSIVIIVLNEDDRLK